MSGSVSGLPAPRPVQAGGEASLAHAEERRTEQRTDAVDPKSASQVTLSSRGHRALRDDALRRFVKDEPAKALLRKSAKSGEERVRDEGQQERVREDRAQERVRSEARGRAREAREQAEAPAERRVSDYDEGYVRLYQSQHPELTEDQARQEVRRLLSNESRRREGSERVLRHMSKAPEHTFEASG